MTMKKLIRKILRENHDMDWVENTGPIPLKPYEVPDIGEKLICVPGLWGGSPYSATKYSHGGGVYFPDETNNISDYGGPGYKDGRVIVVEKVITNFKRGHINRNIVIPDDPPPSSYPFKFTPTMDDAIYVDALARI